MTPADAGCQGTRACRQRAQQLKQQSERLLASRSPDLVALNGLVRTLAALQQALTYDAEWAPELDSLRRLATKRLQRGHDEVCLAYQRAEAAGQAEAALAALRTELSLFPGPAHEPIRRLLRRQIAQWEDRQRDKGARRFPSTRMQGFP